MNKILRLGELAEVGTGNSAPQNEAFFKGGKLPFVRTSDVGAIHIGSIESSRDLLTPEGAKGLKLQQSGTILFPKSGASTFLNHRVILGSNAYVSSHLATIKANSEYALDRYIFYFLQTVDARNLCQDQAYPSLNRDQIAGIEVPLPSLEEQKKIVEKLDGAFAEIADLEMRIDLLKNFISEMESSTLNGVLANSKRKLRIGDICTVTSSKRIFKSEYVEDGIPFYRTKELKELANNRKIRTELFISRERFSEIKNKYGIPINGDLLISAVGTIGEVLVIDNLGDFYFKDGNIVWLKSISRDFDSDFLAMCLRNITKMLNDTAQGSAYSALTIEKLVEIEIPEISKKEQLEIIKKFSELSQAIKEFEYNLVKKNELVFELRKSFLRDALEPSEAVA